MKLTELLNHLERACADGVSKKAYLETAIAIELAFAMALPSQRVDCPVAYFEQMHQALAQRVIGEVNELFPISLQSAYKLTVDLYIARYKLVHEPRLLDATQISNLLDSTAVRGTLTDDYRKALYCSYLNVGRSTMADFVGRYVLPAQTA